MCTSFLHVEHFQRTTPFLLSDRARTAKTISDAFFLFSASLSKRPLAVSSSWNKRKEAKEKFKAVTKKLKNNCVPLKSSNSHFCQNSYHTTYFTRLNKVQNDRCFYASDSDAFLTLHSVVFLNAWGSPHFVLSKGSLNLSSSQCLSAAAVGFLTHAFIERATHQTILLKIEERGPNIYPGSGGTCAG